MIGESASGAGDMTVIDLLFTSGASCGNLDNLATGLAHVNIY